MPPSSLPRSLPVTMPPRDLRLLDPLPILSSENHLAYRIPGPVVLGLPPRGPMTENRQTETVGPETPPALRV